MAGSDFCCRMPDNRHACLSLALPDIRPNPNQKMGTDILTFSTVVKTPVDSTTYLAPAEAQSMAAGSLVNSLVNADSALPHRYVER